ncbi:MAG: WD40/YVTN/BNR-like repeat-containing protein, partial [Blastocatellia bacterium]
MVTRRIPLKRVIASLTFFLALACVVAAVAAAQQSQSEGQASPFKGLSWRQIGPFRGGRAVACTGVPSQPNVFYFGATGGGVWKSTDGGANWRNVSDGFFGTGSVGAIAVADSDPNVVYVGMGECAIRGNVSYGDGVYKSTDAGKTWKNIGLKDTQQISRVRVDPKNADVVYVAALGHVWGANQDRGVFKSTDAGKTWKKVLYKSDRAGATDMVLDPTNASIMYAALWEAYRTPYTLVSGGPGSGLYKSTDAGETWTELTHNPGMPKGVIGNIGLAVSPAQPDRVWALVENTDGGVFRS